MAGTPGKNKKRMISLTAFGVIVLVVVIAANVVVWKNNRDKQSQIAGLQSEISQVQQKIKASPATPADLDARLAVAQAALAEAQNVLPGTISRNDVIDYILNTGAQSQVQVVPLVSAGLAPGNAKQSYRVFTFTATITGTLENAMDFMTRLQGDKFPTLVITDCSVTKIEATDFARPEKSTHVTVSLSIAVYIASPATSEDDAS
jgi:septal ring factor EnvC (AmiA/AmiB activator)